jgi:hypothetical protein
MGLPPSERKEFARAQATTLHSARASLCALGEYWRRHAVFAPLYQHVQIPQKTIKYRPVDKLLEALVGMLCGAKTIAQSNVTVRVDPAVQRAFGRKGCADQSTIARTLQASPPRPWSNWNRSPGIISSGTATPRATACGSAYCG